jgi:hypothetical protein
MKMLPMTRFGRIRTTDEISTIRDGKTVITHPQTLVEVEAENGVVVGIVSLADLLGDMSRRLAGLADMSERLAAVEALATAKPGDTPEVEELKKQFADTAKGRKKGNERSAKARAKNKKHWQTEIGAHIGKMRAKEPDLTNNEIITRLTDKTEPWPFKFKRLSRSTLEKVMPLWE